LAVTDWRLWVLALMTATHTYMASELFNGGTSLILNSFSPFSVGLIDPFKTQRDAAKPKPGKGTGLL